MRLPLDDPRVAVRHVARLEEAGGWWRMWRIDPDSAWLVGSEDLSPMARCAAGVRLELETDASTVELPMRVDAGDEKPDYAPTVDVVVDGTVVSRQTVGDGTTVVRAALPGGMVRVELWLPQQRQVEVGALRLDGAEHASAPPPDAVRWLTYGSSITHCINAPGPTETWPALVARRLGWDHVNLGLAGQCFLDPVVADRIAELPADVISCCLGINVYNIAAFSDRTWRAAVSGFLGRIRRAHPSTPLLVVSPIASPDREDAANEVGVPLRQVRADVHEVVRRLQEAGDANLHVVDGTTVLAPEDAHLLFDGLHPDPAGYRLIADRLQPLLARLATGLR